MGKAHENGEMGQNVSNHCEEQKSLYLKYVSKMECPALIN